MRIYLLLVGLAPIFSISNSAIADETCSIEPFKQIVLEKQEKVWKNYFEYTARKSGFFIVEYSGNQKILQESQNQIVFDYNPNVKTKDANLVLATTFDDGSQKITTLQRSFSLNGIVTKHYNGDGSFEKATCDSEIRHFNPTAFVTEYSIVNVKTNVVVTDSDFYFLAYHYCLKAGFDEPRCFQFGLPPPDYSTSIMNVVNEESFASYEL